MMHKSAAAGGIRRHSHPVGYLTVADGLGFLMTPLTWMKTGLIFEDLHVTVYALISIARPRHPLINILKHRGVT